MSLPKGGIFITIRGINHIRPPSLREGLRVGLSPWEGLRVGIS